jgi:NAD(P)-dependent dehydrogenase (short-subunit alcohol dehydrogenase family)
MFGFDLIRYAVSKAAVALFTKELQRRLDEQGLPIVSVAVHPGEVATEGLMVVNYLFIRTIARLFFLASEQGAATSAFAATAIEVRQNIENYKGKFLVPIGKVESPNAVVEDDQQVKGLWEITNVEVNEQLVTEDIAPLDVW